jgi:hypothetical protein
MSALAESAPRRWVVVHHARPFTANEVRRHHWSWTREQVEVWRASFWGLAKLEKIPHLDCVRIEVNHWYSRGSSPDVGACAPAVKAAIDGLVDAHVIDDDDPAHLVGITYRPALVLPASWKRPGVTGALGLVIEEVL